MLQEQYTGYRRNILSVDLNEWWKSLDTNSMYKPISILIKVSTVFTCLQNFGDRYNLKSQVNNKVECLNTKWKIRKRHGIYREALFQFF